MRKKVKVILREIWDLYKGYRFSLFLLVFTVYLFFALNVTVPFFAGKIVDSISQKNWNMFISMIGGMAIILLIRPFLSHIQDVVMIKTLNNKLERNLEKLTLEKFLSFSLGQHLSSHSSIKSSVLSRGVIAIGMIMDILVYEVSPILFNLLVPVVLVFLVNWKIGLVMSFVIIITLAYVIFYNRKFFLPTALARKYFEDSGRVSKDIIHGVTTVITHSREIEQTGRYAESLKRAYDYNESVWTKYVNYFFFGSIWQTSSLITLQFLAGYFIFKGEITLGSFVTLASWFSLGMGNLQSIAGMQRRFLTYFVDVVKFFDLMGINSDVVEKQDAVILKKSTGTICFENVTFSYPKRQGEDKNGDDEGDGVSITEQLVKALSSGIESGNTERGSVIIRSLNICFNSGKRYAIVGPSGAGKSTLAHLMLRAFDPDSGAVKFDGIDIRDINIRSLRDQFGVVPQEIFVFDGTLRENILFGLSTESMKKVTEEDIERAVRDSRVSEFLPKLEKGLDTVLGEKGLKLSGGQRQRVGIARALIKNPRVLIFDEATSHLDVENEGKIREAIISASEGKTLIMIAHRLATVRDADVIVVMKDGEIVGSGSHEMLLESCETYRDLVKNQVF